MCKARLEASPPISMADAPRISRIRWTPCPGDGTGTVDCSQKKYIQNCTGCKVAVRQRPKWKRRMYAIIGPTDMLPMAADLTRRTLLASQSPVAVAPPAPVTPPAAGFSPRPSSALFLASPHSINSSSNAWQQQHPLWFPQANYGHAQTPAGLGAYFMQVGMQWHAHMVAMEAVSQSARPIAPVWLTRPSARAVQQSSAGPVARRRGRSRSNTSSSSSNISSSCYEIDARGRSRAVLVARRAVSASSSCYRLC